MTLAGTRPSEEGILNFVGRYGPLGVSRILTIPADLVVDAPGFEHVAYGEPLTVWLREVTELQQALSLWQQAKHVKPLGDPDALKMFRDLIAASPHPATTGPWPDVSDDSITMPHVKLLTVASIDPANTLSEKDARHLAWLHLSHVVTARLKTHTEPCLVYAEALARPQFHVVPKTLLGAVWGRVPIGVEKRNGAFFRKVDHHLRAVLQDGLRRNAPWESIPARSGSRVTRAAAPWGS